MLNTILVVSTLFFAAFILYKMLARETGFSFSIFTWKPQTKWITDETGNNFFAYFFVPILLFVILLAVLKLTDHKLGWFSFTTRDGATFIALTITYFVFASAFMQEKDKAKKAPFYQKVMVFTMIMAVNLSLMGASLSSLNPWNWWHHEPPAPISESVRSAGQEVPRKQVHKLVLTAKNREFVEVSIKDSQRNEDWGYHCPKGTLMDFEYTGRPGDDNLIDCDEPSSYPHLGDGKTGRRIRFISKSEVDTYPTVTIVN